jgi:hypothetical protein
MRFPAAVLLLAGAAVAQPPVAKDFVRMKELREKIAIRTAQLQEKEEYEKKPREEKILIAFERGEEKFDKIPKLTGKVVVETCLEWAEIQQAEPTEAGKRVLARLPLALEKRFAQVLEVNRKDRYDASQPLLEGLNSDFPLVRVAAFESLKKMYRTQNAQFYVPSMDKKARQKPISEWKKFVQNQYRK